MSSYAIVLVVFRNFGFAMAIKTALMVLMKIVRIALVTRAPRSNSLARGVNGAYRCLGYAIMRGIAVKMTLPMR